MILLDDYADKRKTSGYLAKRFIISIGCAL